MQKRKDTQAEHMPVKKPSFKNFNNYIKKIPKKLPLIGNETIVTLRKRTMDGIDMNGHPFRPYSKLYGEWKMEEHGISSPNLVVTSRMLNSITYKSIPKGIRLYFNSSTETKKAYENHHKHKRPFFGLTKNERNKVVKRLRRVI